MPVTPAKSDRDAALAGLRAVHARLTALEAANEQLERELASVQDEIGAARSDAALQQQAADAARAELLQVTTEFERANDELRREYAAAVGEQALTCTALPLDGLLTAFAGLERATSAADLLDNVVTALAREFSRVALFRVRGNQLQGARQTGFDLPDDISKVALPLAADSLLARAVSSRQLESVLTNGEPDPILPFGGSPVCAVAIPLILRAEIAGVVYADDSDTPGFTASAPHTRLKFAELLRQHACLLLLKMSVQDGRFGELRDIAVVLVDELEGIYKGEGDAAGGAHLDRQERLIVALEQARRMYRRHVARQQAPAALTYLDDQLAAAVASRPDAPFSRELARILPRASVAARAQVVAITR
jgi:hypothetical protein